MKKLFLLLFLLVNVMASAQKAWTVQMVPNTRRQSNDIHVSDPDSFLSNRAEKDINTALCAIRNKADVFVVTLSSIGRVDSKRFATELFNYWGIGDAKADNGVLLLFVEDQHKLELETGYGAEKILTDARCQRIITQTIKPYFKAGNYERGICAGVADIVSVYGGTISQELLSSLTGKSSAQTVWTVQTVPNPRLKGNDNHVSDPDDFLSDEAEQCINKALNSIRDKVDVIVVPLITIGDVETNQFSPELFRYWGIGDDVSGNGVLLLLCKEQNIFDIHRGYGIGETVNDAVSNRIFTKTINPYLQVDDFDGAFRAGVADIVEIYGGDNSGLKRPIQTIWTVQTVPNPRLKGNDIHVVDPDGILSDSVKQVINEALCSIRDKADVLVVSLASIGRADPKSFANDLFNSWDIGDAKADNGVLMLLVKDQHQYWCKRGYGTEKYLTASVYKRINKSMLPYFHNRDYDDGFCAGVSEILRAYDSPIPKGLKVLLPRGGFTIRDFNWFSGSVFIVLLLIVPIFSFVRWLRHRKDKSILQDDVGHKDEHGIVYFNGIEPWSGSPWEGRTGLRALTFGLSPFVALIIAFVLVVAICEGRLSEAQMYAWIAVGTMVIYFTIICLVQNICSLRITESLAQKWIYPKYIFTRAKNNFQTQITWWLAPWLGIPFYFVFKRKIAESQETRCPTCGESLRLYSGINLLTEIHTLEAKLKALNFKSYNCSQGHRFVWQERGTRFSYFCKCEKCGGYTMKQIESQTIREASYSNKGEKVITYKCQCCGQTMAKNLVIPMKVRNDGYGRNSDTGGGGYSSSDGGGSFGGGESGGGGASGDW